MTNGFGSGGGTTNGFGSGSGTSMNPSYGNRNPYAVDPRAMGGAGSITNK
jgi:hypothetical protein